MSKEHTMGDGMPQKALNVSGAGLGEIPASASPATIQPEGVENWSDAAWAEVERCAPELLAEHSPAMKVACVVYAAALPTTPEWQPIDTAPKDGTDILLCRVFHPPIVAGFYDGEWKDFDSADAIKGGMDVTHWMPLPQPPRGDV